MAHDRRHGRIHEARLYRQLLFIEFVHAHAARHGEHELSEAAQRRPIVAIEVRRFDHGVLLRRVYGFCARRVIVYHAKAADGHSRFTGELSRQAAQVFSMGLHASLRQLTDFRHVAVLVLRQGEEVSDVRLPFRLVAENRIIGAHYVFLRSSEKLRAHFRSQCLANGRIRKADDRRADSRLAERTTELRAVPHCLHKRLALRMLEASFEHITSVSGFTKGYNVVAREHVEKLRGFHPPSFI